MRCPPPLGRKLSRQNSLRIPGGTNAPLRSSNAGGRPQLNNFHPTQRQPQPQSWAYGTQFNSASYSGKSGYYYHNVAGPSGSNPYYEALNQHAQSGYVTLPPGTCSAGPSHGPYPTPGKKTKSKGPEETVQMKERLRQLKRRRQRRKEFCAEFDVRRFLRQKGQEAERVAQTRFERLCLRIQDSQDYGPEEALRFHGQALSLRPQSLDTQCYPGRSASLSPTVSRSRVYQDYQRNWINLKDHHHHVRFEHIPWPVLFDSPVLNIEQITPEAVVAFLKHPSRLQALRITDWNSMRRSFRVEQRLWNPEGLDPLVELKVVKDEREKVQEACALVSRLLNIYFEQSSKETFI